MQDDENGTFHPNAPGHGRYSRQIREALVSDLYVGGDLSRPRHPA